MRQKRADVVAQLVVAISLPEIWLIIRHSLPVFINFLLVFPREPQCFSVLLILVLLLTLLAVLCSVLFFVLIFVNHAAARIIRDYDQKCMIKYWHQQN